MYKCAQFRGHLIQNPLDRFIGLLKSAAERSGQLCSVLKQTDILRLIYSVMKGYYDFLGSPTSKQRDFREEVCTRLPSIIRVHDCISTTAKA